MIKLVTILVVFLKVYLKKKFFLCAANKKYLMTLKEIVQSYQACK